MRKVKWSIRDDGNSTWAKHFAGDYVVTVTDMDGDGTEWEVWLRTEYESIRNVCENDDIPDPIAKGYVCVRAYEDFKVGQAVAIEALDAIVRARQPEQQPGELK